MIKVISNKKRVNYAWVIGLTGIGITILTFNLASIDEIKLDTWIHIYCIINSILIVLSAIFLAYKKINMYNIFTFLLSMLIFFSFFVTADSSSHVFTIVKESLGIFLSTGGMFIGLMNPLLIFGIFIVPIFLFNGVYGLIVVIGHWLGKVKYEFESDIIKA